MILEKGRPENNEGRLAKEIRVYDFLDSLGIEYFRVDHEAAMTMEDCEKVDEVLGVMMCKNLFRLTAVRLLPMLWQGQMYR